MRREEDLLTTIGEEAPWNDGHDRVEVPIREWDVDVHDGRDNQPVRRRSSVGTAQAAASGVARSTAALRIPASSVIKVTLASSATET